MHSCIATWVMAVIPRCAIAMFQPWQKPHDVAGPDLINRATLVLHGDDQGMPERRFYTATFLLPLPRAKFGTEVQMAKSPQKQEAFRGPIVWLRGPAHPILAID
jgi:hypothetical protein